MLGLPIAQYLENVLRRSSGCGTCSASNFFFVSLQTFYILLITTALSIGCIPYSPSASKQEMVVLK
jgi:hypothetical protein